MLERLRLIDGVNTVTLLSSTKGTGGGGCPANGPAFSVTVQFDGLPSAAAASAAAVKSPAKTTVSDSTTSAGAVPAATAASGGANG